MHLFNSRIMNLTNRSNKMRLLEIQMEQTMRSDHLSDSLKTGRSPQKVWSPVTSRIVINMDKKQEHVPTNFFSRQNNNKDLHLTTDT
jgi:hypothetical protein